MSKHRVAACLLAVLMLTGCAGTQLATKEKEMNDALLVVIDDPIGASGLSASEYAARMNADDAIDVHQVAMDIADQYSLNVLGDWPVNHLGVYCFVVDIPADAVIDALEADTRVNWTQPVNTMEMKSTDAGVDDPSSAAHALMQTFMQDVDERGRDVTIAVIDTDVDESHPDLRSSRLSVINFAGSRGMPMKETHGTAVIGLITAKAADPSGLTGVAHAADVHLLRACWEPTTGQGACNTLTLSMALNAAIDLQPHIINLSLSGEKDRILDALIDRLVDNGTLVIAAFDEQRGAQNRFPTAREGVLFAYGVADDRPRPQMDDATIVYAPRQALSLAPMSGYDLVSGHSFTAPLVTAMAACFMHRYPQAGLADVTAHLQRWLADHD